ncbi:30S ribosomal protein S20 [Candidatus Wolfebacteria bacterium]|nr:30S ribosomal protein S20 [Candidatus Wolfebacteria bacterium]
MPITASAAKAMRQTARRRKVNAKRKQDLRTIIKNYKKLALTSREEAQKQLPLVYKRIDKSAKTNIIKKNKASRMKSKLTKLLK